VSLLWATITQMNCNRPCRVDPLRRESGTLIRSRLTGTRFLLTYQLRMPVFRLSWVSFSNTTLLSEAFTWMPKSFAKLSLWRTMLFEEAPGACPGVRTLISGGSVTVGETLSDRQATTTSASTGRQNEQWMSNALRALCCGGVTTIALPRKPVKL